MHLTSLLVSSLRKLAFSNTKQVKSFKMKAKSQQITILVRVRPGSARLPTWASTSLPARTAAGPGLLSQQPRALATTANRKLKVHEIPSFDQFPWPIPLPQLLSCAGMWPVLKEITILEDSHANPSPGSGPPLGEEGGWGEVYPWGSSLVLHKS